MRVYFTHSRCILSCINGYISDLSAEHDLASITNIVDQPFFFFLLVLSVSIWFLQDYTLLHFYFSWLVEICIKDWRGVDSRAEQSNSGVLRACCRSERRWVNRAPRWRPVPWVIATPRRSERWTRRHRSEIGQTLNFISYSIFILALRSIKVRYFSILTFSCAMWLAQEYVRNHM